jgi:hypothetical protein
LTYFPEYFGELEPSPYAIFSGFRSWIEPCVAGTSPTRVPAHLGERSTQLCAHAGLLPDPAGASARQTLDEHQRDQKREGPNRYGDSHTLTLHSRFGLTLLVSITTRRV